MLLFLLTKPKFKRVELDVYDSIIVAAPDPRSAQQIHPDGENGWGATHNTWADRADSVQVEYLGEAHPGIKAGVILASFNAG